MGLFDFLTKSEEEREKNTLVKQGRDLYYHDADAGIKQIADNATSRDDWKLAANKQWEKVKDKSGRDAANADPDYKKYMGKYHGTTD